MAEDFNRHHGAKDRQFHVGDNVYYQRHSGMKWTWQPGIVIKRLGAANYEVKEGEKVTKLHANQLKHRPAIENTPGLDDDYIIPLLNHFQIPTTPLTNAETSSEDDNSEGSSVAEEFESADEEIAADDSTESSEPEVPPVPVYTRPHRNTAGKLPDRLKDFIIDAVVAYLTSK
jgi:hypothetical protein